MRASRGQRKGGCEVKQDKAFNATADGQKAMCARAGRIAVLLQINNAVRKLAPSEAYDDSFITATLDSQIDSMLELLRHDYNRLIEDSRRGHAEFVKASELSKKATQ
jgi:hypothetical protein